MSDGSTEEVPLTSAERKKQPKRVSLRASLADARNPAHFIPTGTVLAKSAWAETNLVYMGRSENIYVMKKFKKSFVLSHVSERRLRASLSVHLAINHPCLVRLLYFLEDREAFYLISEYAGRGNLLSHLATHKALTEEQAFPIFIDCASALNHLHEHGVSLPRLSLEDILQTEEGVKLSAFSLSAVLRKGDDGRRLSQPVQESDAQAAAGHAPSSRLLAGLLVQLLTGDLRPIADSGIALLEDFLRGSAAADLKISTECHAFVRFLTRTQPVALPDILSHNWVTSMYSRGRRDTKDAMKALLRGGRSGSFIAQQSTAKKRVSLTSCKKEASEFSPPSRLSKEFSPIRDISTAGDKNYWRKKSRFAANTDISMSSPRFFDTRQLAESSAGEREKKLRDTQKGFFQQLAEAFGCATRD